ncbi:MAG: hypothetical protein COW85_03085 [Ignavibacteria bacterium CG22_combo_CG10-13_8_21_14_all_37_15]|nr:hypothetical protein [Ignavibacteria bacterium]PIP78748.1 MAG: hypothetical protein COW85_03085 [Ignavibacteria bacterium CG22_combo_CG10-13_8_21_14_all_37_15]PJC61018.1 MAG: hypothetical protein CO025_01200 [Ignavibacteria bacterium CG_4_9_14_0_2_um_filter_37_13]
MDTKVKTANQPKTGFGKWMVHTVIPNYANNVQGVVYMGAAILIIIVGLRGLGKVAGQIAIVPKFLLGVDGKIDPNWVMMALFLEFFLLLILSMVTFFTPEDSHGSVVEHSGKAVEKFGLDVTTIKQELSQLKGIAYEDLKVIDDYVEKMTQISKRLAHMNKEYLAAVNEVKQTYKADTFRAMAVEELKGIDVYVEKIAGLTQKITGIRNEYMKTMNELKQSFKV